MKAVFTVIGIAAAPGLIEGIISQAAGSSTADWIAISFAAIVFAKVLFSKSK